MGTVDSTGAAMRTRRCQDLSQRDGTDREDRGVVEEENGLQES